MPLVILPPGELIYIEISSLFKESKYNNSLTTILAVLSLISPVIKIIRSFSNLEYKS